MNTAISTSSYFLGRRTLENMTSSQDHERTPVFKESFSELYSFISKINYRPHTALYRTDREPRTDTVDLEKVIKLTRSLNSSRDNIEDLLFANSLKSAVETKIITNGLDKGVRYLLKSLKDNLLNNEYSKCDTFIQIMQDSVPEFDLRLHVCILTLTSHWKTYLSARGGYFLSIEQFVNNSFVEAKAKQILSGLE